MIDDEHTDNVLACGMACIFLIYLWYTVWNALSIHQYTIDLWEIVG